SINAQCIPGLILQPRSVQAKFQVDVFFGRTLSAQVDLFQDGSLKWIFSGIVGRINLYAIQSPVIHNAIVVCNRCGDGTIWLLVDCIQQSLLPSSSLVFIINITILTGNYSLPPQFFENDIEFLSCLTKIHITAI